MAFFLTATPVFGSEAVGLANLVVAAYGGAETIEGNKFVKQTGVLDSKRHGKSGTIERTFSRPDKLRIEIRIPGVPPESRILNGSQGWRDGREVPPMMARAMLLQAARLDLPYLIMKAGQTIKMFGPAKRDGDRVLKGLEIPMEDGLRLIVIVDAETGYIFSSHGLILLAPNQGMEFTTIYSNHKNMNGTVFATEETHFAQGQSTGKTTLETTKILPELSDSVFTLKGEAL